MSWTFPTSAARCASTRCASIPNKLVSYGLSIGQVEQQLANNNINAGGSFVEVGMQQMNVRALGLFSSVQRHRADGSENSNRHCPAGQGHRGSDAGSQNPAGPHGQGQSHGGRAHHRRARRHPGRGADAQGRRRSSPRSMPFTRKWTNSTTASCPRREGRSHAGPQRSAAFHAAHGDAQPGRRDDPGQRHPVPVSAAMFVPLSSSR